jgi:hypothetical protein
MEATSLYLEETKETYTKHPVIIANFEFNLPSYA